MSNVVGFADHQIEHVPQPDVFNVLDDQFPGQIVRVITVSVEERGEKAEKLDLFNDFLLFIEVGRAEGGKRGPLQLGETLALKEDLAHALE